MANEINDNDVLKLLKLVNRFKNDDEDSFNKLRWELCRQLDIINNEKINFNLSKFRETEIDTVIQSAILKLKCFGYKTINSNMNFFRDIGNSSHIINSSVIETFYESRIPGGSLDGDQKKFLDFFSKHRRVMLSAPTSFGKTFLLKEIIFSGNYKKILLIFSLNSLLTENLEEINILNNRMNNKYQIKIRPEENINWSSGNYIFILTPERFLSLLNLYPDVEFDFSFMDEIYKIDDKKTNKDSKERKQERDVLFRTALYNLSKKTDDFYIAGPYLQEDLLGEGFRYFLSHYKIKPIFFYNEKINKKYEKNYKNEKVRNSEKKRVIKSILQKNDETFLIYVSKKTLLFNLANHLKDKDFLLRKNVDEGTYTNLNDFCEHLKTTFSNEGNIWQLPYFLEHGIGLHCGSFPKYVQREILNFFNKGMFKVLISTTSIVEGVNVTAKNLIFYSSKKGNSNLTKFDIKNIEGRAGRYYHHYSGSVHYLDKEIENILERDSLYLDFVNFSSKGVVLGDLDIANTDLTDLRRDDYQKRKIEILKVLEQNEIPEKVVKANYSVDWKKQIILIQKMRESFKNDSNQLSLISCGLKASTMSENFRIAFHLIMKFLTDVFPEVFYPKNGTSFALWIYEAYRRNGLWGLVQYHKRNIKGKKEKVSDNDAFQDAILKGFDDESHVIQFLIPKYLDLFVNLFNFISKSKLNAEDIRTRFEFEDSIQYAKLFDKGLPLETIKKLKKFNVIDLNKFEQLINKNEFTKYEIKLIERIK